MESSEWENSKENIAPVKSGRSIKGLGGARGGLSNKPVIGKELGEMEEEKRFERDIAAAMSKPESNDRAQEILSAYLAYYKYVKRTYASSHDKTRAVLERATNELKDIEVVKNNEMYVKLWIELADMSRTPSETFGFMQANKIGEKVALFYIAWAFVAEKADKFDVTEKIFKKAIKHQAEPRKMLQSRFQQFQRRMISRIRDGEIAVSREEKDNVVQASCAGSREALTELSRSATRRNSSIRTGEAVSTRPTGGLNRDENRRERIASNNSNRLDGTVSDSRVSSSVEGAARGNSSSGVSRARAGSGKTTARPTNNFMIFSDSDVTQAPSTEPQPEKYEEDSEKSNDKRRGSNWSVLGPESKRVKENHVPVSTWSEAPLRGGASTSPTKALSFTIFSDATMSSSVAVDPPIAEMASEMEEGRARPVNLRMPSLKRKKTLWSMVRPRTNSRVSVLLKLVEYLHRTL